MTSVGNRVFLEVIELNEVNRVSPNPMTDTHKKGILDTERDDVNRDRDSTMGTERGEASRSQRMPKVASKPLEARREPGTDPPSQHQREPTLVTP